MVEFEKIKTSELKFDLKNPRLVEFDLNDDISFNDMITILWNKMDAKEVAMSIVASGYFEHEPLIVSDENKNYIVIEGNRRLAAVNVLLKPIDFPEISAIPQTTPKLLLELDSLPVIFQSREDSWKFLGFKHVNGPAKWNSYAKAKYISQVHDTYGISLDQIGIQIGDTHKTVQKLYRGLMVIEQAEREKVFSREDRSRKSFAFSHIYVGLQKEGIKEFLAIDDDGGEEKDPIPKNKITELGELCAWIYGSKRDEIEPIVQSQNPNLKQLDKVLRNRESLAALRAGESLEYSLSLTIPSSTQFEEELLNAKRSLVKARGLLSEGYDKSHGLLKVAESIADIAWDLYDEMERKSIKPRRSSDLKN